METKSQTEELLGEGIHACTSMALQDLSILQETIGEAVIVEMEENNALEESGLVKMILSPFIMAMLAPKIEQMMNKIEPAFGNRFIGILAFIICLPLAVGIAHSLVQTLSEKFGVLIVEASINTVATLVVEQLTLTLGADVVNIMITSFTGWYRAVAIPQYIGALADALVPLIGQSIVSAVGAAVTKAITNPISKSLTQPILSYNYCVYCYTYGDYCEYCMYNKNLQGMERAWWLGGQTS